MFLPRQRYIANNKSVLTSEASEQQSLATDFAKEANISRANSSQLTELIELTEYTVNGARHTAGLRDIVMSNTKHKHLCCKLVVTLC